jgi:hypothetical protein
MYSQTEGSRSLPSPIPPNKSVDVDVGAYFQPLATSQLTTDFNPDYCNSQLQTTNEQPKPIAKQGMRLLSIPRREWPLEYRVALWSFLALVTIVLLYRAAIWFQVAFDKSAVARGDLRSVCIDPEVMHKRENPERCATAASYLEEWLLRKLVEAVWEDIKILIIWCCTTIAGMVSASTFLGVAASMLLKLIPLTQAATTVVCTLNDRSKRLLQAPSEEENTHVL